MRTTIGAVSAAAALLLAGCSDGRSLPEPVAVDTTSELTGTPATADPADSTVTQPASEVTEPSRPVPSTTEFVLDPIPETGVPGLDSDDLFCAAWSRFGGTWQVLTVGSAFLDAPRTVAIWEVVASELVEEAYNDLIANLPVELSAEADAVRVGYFGALHGRAVEARGALGDAGATAADAATLARAWLDALSSRDQFEADVGVVVPAELQSLVDVAADRFLADRGTFGADPAMIVTVETPLTDDYLATACPDRGSLAGQEVGDTGGDSAGDSD